MKTVHDGVMDAQAWLREGRGTQELVEQEAMVAEHATSEYSFGYLATLRYELAGRDTRNPLIESYVDSEPTQV